MSTESPQSIPWRWILRVIAGLVMAVSIAWLISDFGFEPLIGLLSAIAGLIVSLIGESKETQEPSPAAIPTDGSPVAEGTESGRPRVVNLRPLDVTHSFKDRLQEIDQLCAYLSEDDVRLVSIVGRGGMGKTVLACRVLADLEEGTLPAPDGERELVADGILYLSAQSTGLGLERIYADVGQVLGQPTASRLATFWASPNASLTAKVETLLQAMQGGLYLILLDNLESLLTEENTIAEEGLRLFVEHCLMQPTGARLIVTSRRRVRFSDAGLPNVRTILLGEGLPEKDALSLLRELDPQGMLGLRDAPIEDLRRTFQLTGGIPRALELVAGILHRDPTTRLNTLLDDSALFGEQVVEQLVAEGYRRLSEDEQRVMEALAVLDRPVIDEAIVYLLQPWCPDLPVQDCLRRLVSSYLVRTSRVTGEYSLHTLDREHSYSQIPGDDQAGGYHRRNLELRAAGFYASLCKPESEWACIEDLAPQLAEFEHRIRAQDRIGASRVLDEIDADYLFLWGHYTRLADMREELQPLLVDPVRRGANLSRLGLLYHSMGEIERTFTSYKEALVILGGTKDLELKESTLSRLGWAYHSLGQVERAFTCYTEALAIADEMGDPGGRQRGLSNLGSAYADLGRFERSITLYEEALAIAREIGDRRWTCIHLGRLGSAFVALGEADRAIGSYEESLTLAREIGDRRIEGVRLDQLGQAYRRLGEFDRAVELHHQALRIAREIGDRRGESYRLVGLGRAALIRNQLDEARTYCEQALALNVLWIEYGAALTLGIVLLRQGDWTAQEILADTIARCDTLLAKVPRLYLPRYVRAASLLAQGVCDTGWTDGKARGELLAQPLAEYQRALENCSAEGIVQDAVWNLEQIQSAGVEGLEPVFELLQNALQDSST